LVEFKAGKMIMEGKMVRPDKRKGLVQLRQSEDGLIHFIWKERVSGQTENDLIIFPDDAVFRKVKESNGRVYLLEFKNSSKRLFFWMQDLSDEKDDQRVTDINKYIAEPPQPDRAGDLSGLNQDQLLRLLAQQGGLGALRNQLQQGARRQEGSGSGAGGTRAPAAVPRPAASSGTPAANTPAPRPAQPAGQPLQLSALRNMLAGLPDSRPPADKAPQLNDIINPDDVVASGLFEHPDVVQKLAEFLPQGPVTAQNMKEHVRSAQFQQAVTLFNQALRSGEMATIMTNFGIDASTIGPNATIEDFLLAVQKQVKKDQEKAAAEKK